MFWKLNIEGFVGLDKYERDNFVFGMKVVGVDEDLGV